MNSKRATTTATSNSSVKPNFKLNMAPPKIDTRVKPLATLKANDESLFSTNLTNILETEPSCNPSPMLKQNIMDILQILPESPLKLQVLPQDEETENHGQPMQGLKLFQFNKQDQVENALKEQISTFKRDLDLRDKLIEKLMRENANLKNEIKELLVIELRTKREATEKNVQLQEEIKSLKLELSNYKEQKQKNPQKNVIITQELNQLKATIDDYHEGHSQYCDAFISQLNNQVSGFITEIQKKHVKLNNHIQDFKKVNQAKKNPLKQHSQTPKASHKNKLLHKDDRNSTPKSQLNRDFKKELMLRSLRTFEFEDDDSKNNSLFSKIKLDPKCLTQRTDESFEFKSLF